MQIANPIYDVVEKDQVIGEKDRKIADLESRLKRA